MKIGFASDHRGYKLKKQLIEQLQDEYEIIDYGTSSEASTDYPDYAFLLGENVSTKKVDFGIAICGSGIGISIACNKVLGVRCAKVTTAEEAKITRIDNDANIVAFGENTTFLDALNIVKTFVSTDHPSMEKHDRRIRKIKEYEETH